MKKNLLLLILVFIFASPALADKWILNVPKDTLVAVKIPHTLFKSMGRATGAGRHMYEVKVDEASSGEMIIGGAIDWQDKSWVFMRDFEVREIAYRKDKNYEGYEVNLIDNDISLRLRFTVMVKDVPKTFDKLIFVGSKESFQKTDYYRREVVDRFFPRFFPYPMSQFSEEEKFGFLAQSDYAENRNFSLFDYKGGKYFARGWFYTFNYSDLTKTGRSVWVINEAGLRNVKSLVPIIKKYKDFAGIKIVEWITFPDASAAEGYRKEMLEIYAPLDAAIAFADDDITSSEFIDKCVVLIDGNRTKIDLAQR